MISNGINSQTPAHRFLRVGRRLIQRTMWGPRTQKFFWLTLLVAIIGLSVVICVLGIEEFVNGNSEWWQMVIAICVARTLTTGVLLSNHVDRWQLRRDLARLAEAEPACLVCGYELSGLTPEADGCTVCPECGGAWRLEAMFAELRTV